MSGGHRIHWMDAYRGIAVTLVMLGHAEFLAQHVGTKFYVEPLHTVWQILQPYRMPLLFVLSGLLLHRSIKKPLKPYLVGKVRHIAWPYVVWSIILVLALNNWERVATAAYWYRGPTHLWFLRELFIIFVLALFMRRVSPWILTGLCVLGVTLLDPKSQMLGFTMFWAAYAFFGAGIQPALKRIQELGIWFPLLCASSAVVITATTLAAGMPMNYTNPARFTLPIPGNPISMLFPLPGILALFWLGPRIPRLRLFEFIGRRSIVMYCAHTPLIYIAARAVAIQPMADAVAWLIIVVITTAVSLLLTWQYKRVKWLFEMPRISDFKRKRPESSQPSESMPPAAS